MRYIDDPQYLPGEWGQQEDSETGAERDECRVQACSCEVWTGLQKKHTLQAVTLKNIETGAELPVNYVTKYLL